MNSRLTKIDTCLQIEETDYFIRKKDVSKASASLSEAKSALDTVLSAVV